MSGQKILDGLRDAASLPKAGDVVLVKSIVRAVVHGRLLTCPLSVDRAGNYGANTTITAFDDIALPALDNRALVEALEPFVFGDETLEKLLWGELDDEATGTVTVKLRDFRRARAALTAARGK